MKKITILMMTALLSLGLSLPAAAADNTTKCGSSIGKALASLIKTAYIEGAKACGAGDDMAPAAVDADKVTRKVDKFNSTLAKAVDKYTADACPAVTPAVAADWISEAEDVADAACQVP